MHCWRFYKITPYFQAPKTKLTFIIFISTKFVNSNFQIQINYIFRIVRTTNCKRLCVTKQYENKTAYYISNFTYTTTTLILHYLFSSNTIEVRHVVRLSLGGLTANHPSLSLARCTGESSTTLLVQLLPILTKWWAIPSAFKCLGRRTLNTWMHGLMWVRFI